jgi:hypothetical protein
LQDGKTSSRTKLVERTDTRFSAQHGKGGGTDRWNGENCQAKLVPIAELAGTLNVKTPDQLRYCPASTATTATMTWAMVINGLPPVWSNESSTNQFACRVRTMSLMETMFSRDP